MKDMLLIYLIIFKYNITCTAMILVYVLYQYYLMLLYHFIYTFNRRFLFVIRMYLFLENYFKFTFIFAFLKIWFACFELKKKMHKWYFILVSLYFFSRIYILIWLSCLNVSLKSNCLQIVLLFRLYGPREATRMSPTVKVFVSYFWIKEQYVIFTWDRCRIFFYHVGVRGRGAMSIQITCSTSFIILKHSRWVRNFKV